MEETYIIQFENLFGLPFTNVTDIIEMNSESYDDGNYHYVDVINKDVYSFDTYDNIWLEKNLYQSDVLHRLNMQL